MKLQTCCVVGKLVSQNVKLFHKLELGKFLKGISQLRMSPSFTAAALVNITSFFLGHSRSILFKSEMKLRNYERLNNRYTVKIYFFKKLQFLKLRNGFKCFH